ncbi:MAG: beta-galactosidase [Paramuribaculum sp.]|nr:beta-galactosidase [Paramuribaculum sp.]
MLSTKTFMSVLVSAGFCFSWAADALASVNDSPRETRSLNNDWRFRFSHEVNHSAARRVDIPHTWNAQDALAGKIDYKRGIGNYTKRVHIGDDLKGKRLYVKCEGANSVCNLFVNGRHVGEHRGGYSAFVFEITDFVDFGKDNTLMFRVNNGEQLDVMPLVGDFNFYGGLYRDVNLIATDSTCVSLLDYGSPGVYLRQNSVTDKQADVTADVRVSGLAKEPQNVTLKMEVTDGDRVVVSSEKDFVLQPGADAQPVAVDFSIENPHLWDGRRDPFMYDVEISLVKDGRVIDRISEPLGLRYYHTDPDNGFFLNGRRVQLFGVNRHQERAGIGNALTPAHHEEDVDIMLDMGVNAMRLAHYQQAEHMYDLTDRNGVVVWAEIPFVGPGGYADKGFVDQESFKANGRNQLIELIRQNYNHPSIMFWGIFNELKEDGDNPVEYVKELNELAHKEDTTRPTTAASNQGGALNFITDNIAWNRYDGWYGSTPATLATWLDATHSKHPELRIGISEYGAGASFYHQQDSVVQPAPGGRWHPENWQLKYHIDNWRIINDRPFVWGSFVWNMFDFGAAHRTEGDRNGINDKGLVSHDRKDRKDAFYFYRANWNPEPMVYIAGRRASSRKMPVTDITVFSNSGPVVLYVNGSKIKEVAPDDVNVCTFSDVTLSPGENRIEVTTGKGKKQLTDSCVWILE